MSKEKDKHHIVKLRRTGNNPDGSRNFDIIVFCDITQRNHRVAWLQSQEDAILYAKKYAKEHNLHYEDYELEAERPRQSRSLALNSSCLSSESMDIEEDEPL